jgi:hypothetical protein
MIPRASLDDEDSFSRHKPGPGIKCLHHAQSFAGIVSFTIVTMML